MSIFVTGATGYIGATVVRTLIAAGHQVTGLVRGVEKEDQLRTLGATPLRGDLKVPESYRAAAAEHDAIIHLAFEYGPEAANADRAAVDTLIAAARQGRARSLVYTSGVLVLGEYRRHAA